MTRMKYVQRSGKLKYSKKIRELILWFRLRDEPAKLISNRSLKLDCKNDFEYIGILDIKIIISFKLFFKINLKINFIMIHFLIKISS